MKKTLILIAVLVLAVSMLASCAVQNTNPPLSVGGTEMTKDEFGYYVYVMKSQKLQEAGIDVTDANATEDFLKDKTDGKKNIDIVIDGAVDEAAKMLVLYNKATEDGITLTEEELSQLTTEIASMKEQVGGEQGYVAQLSQLGTTPEAFEELYRKNTLVSKYAKKLSEDGTVSATDEQIKDYIVNNYVKAQHILFLTQDATTGAKFDENTIAEKKAKAEETLKKVKDGADFKATMNELSEDTGLQSYPDGYEFTKGEMVPQFEEAAFALEENQISDIVESPYGFHIIKRIPLEFTDEKIAELSPNAKIACENQKLEDLVKQWTDETEVKTYKSVLKSYK